jgi:hypothetical protein
MQFVQEGVATMRHARNEGFSMESGPERSEGPIHRSAPRGSRRLRPKRTSQKQWLACIRSSLLLALIVSLCFPALAQEQPPLYLIDTPFVAPIVAGVYEVDPVTGVMELKADLGETYSPFFGLAAASKTVLYGTGTDNTATICTEPGCLLVRIEIDPASTVPTALVVIGPVATDTAIIGAITGLTFRNDGFLYAASQHTNGLYRVDPLTGQADEIGIVDLNVHGGDITFDADDRLFMWTNDGAGSGLFEIDPDTAQATAFEIHPYLGYAGIAALGHGSIMYGASPPNDNLYEIDPVLGLTGVQVLLTLDAIRFDYKRGDLASPFCNDDPFCDDANDCTTDSCAAGGCDNQWIAGCCNDAGDCDDENICTADSCDPVLGCVHTPVELEQTTCGVGACQRTVDACVDGVAQQCVPGSPTAEVCDGIDNDCDGIADNGFPLPTENPALSLGQAADMDVLEWESVPNATMYDVIRGDAVTLHTSLGGYRDSVSACLGDDVAATTLESTLQPGPGEIFWYLVSPCGCGGSMSYDSGGSAQAGSRDAGIEAAPASCP